MWDRESHFADAEIVKLLREKFVPVAVDEWYHSRRKDPEGDFYRKIVFQREGMKEGRTTQGFYAAATDGKLLVGWNNRDVPKMRRFLEQALREFKPSDAGALADSKDGAFARRVPEGGLVVDVFSRVLKADWPEPKSDGERIYQKATGRDHLWITKEEVEALVAGSFPESLARRIARFHLIDNTRGEPPMWAKGEVRELKFRDRVNGSVKLETDSGDRGYAATIAGDTQVKDGQVTRFDLVAKGSFHGEGRYTRGAPPGKFTLGVAFALARPGEASKVPPQGARDVRDYLGR